MDFWWLDWQQYPYTRSVPDLTNLFWLNTLLYAHTAQNGQRGQSFSRWAGWGDHRHPIHFSGDASSSFNMLAFEVPFTSTAGNVGCFFWSHDIGGHNRGRNEESYVRWVQFGATSPVLRSHSTRDATMDRRPWTYPKWAEYSMRIGFHLRSQLFPYIYTSTQESCRDTVPLDRPLYIDYPLAENAYHSPQQYLFGDNLLVAPIVMPGVGPGRVGRQSVWFPPGSWYNYFTGERYPGNTQALVSADINEFPLYVRGGVPLPMQPYQPRMATAPLRTLTVRCFPGPDGVTGRSTLYEDDGLTTKYEQGQFATTPLTYTRRHNSISVTIGATRGHYAGQPSTRRIFVELPDLVRNKSVLVNGQPAKVSYESQKLMTCVYIPAHSIRQTTVVILDALPGGFARLHDRAVTRRIAAVTGKYAPSVKSALADPSLTPAQKEALLALAGVGLVSRNSGPYGYGGTPYDCFYAPSGVLDGNAFQVKSGAASTESEQHVSGDAAQEFIPTPGHSTRIQFRIAGNQFHLPSSPLFDDSNVAMLATVTANGSEDGYRPTGATDGIVGGYPDDKSQEWSSGKRTGGVLRLDWDQPQTVDRIVLYDRPNLDDQVTAGTLAFSDGTALPVGTLPDDATSGMELRFPAKTITWLTFTITAVKPSTVNGGLSEIAVFRSQTPPAIKR